MQKITRRGQEKFLQVIGASESSTPDPELAGKFMNECTRNDRNKRG